jgi:uncharacterized protein YndB with AHSA1/START domain
MTDTRSIDLSVEVPGTPDEVWDTVATGPGISSWFIPSEVDGREGGQVVMDFGAGYGTETTTVTAWEPPHRLMFTGGAERPLGYEWSIDATSAGTCVVRLVNSGFAVGEESDAEFDGMSMGWPLFLENLKLQLTHFRGRRTCGVIPTVATAGPHEDAWSRVCAALGVATDLGPGDRFEPAGPSVPKLAARVDGSNRSPATSHYRLLIDQPAPGTGFVAAEGTGDAVMVSVYLYLYGLDDTAAVADEWAAFLTDRLRPPSS